MWSFINGVILKTHLQASTCKGGQKKMESICPQWERAQWLTAVKYQILQALKYSGGEGGRSAFRRTSRFSKVLNIQKFGFKEQWKYEKERKKPLSTASYCPAVTTELSPQNNAAAPGSNVSRSAPLHSTNPTTNMPAGKAAVPPG